MGRKKARRSSIKRTRTKDAMPRRFTCPECNHENVVVCSLNYLDNIGKATCSVCEATYKCKVHRLMTAIDVYSEWIDDANTKDIHK